MLIGRHGAVHLRLAHAEDLQTDQINCIHLETPIFLEKRDMKGEGGDKPVDLAKCLKIV